MVMLHLLPLIFLVIGSTAGLMWQDDFENNVRWSFDCDFYGNDLWSESSTAQACGPICNLVSECTHFTWSPNEAGTCFLKGGPVDENDVQEIEPGYLICGYIIDRFGRGEVSKNVKGTYWDEKSDVGSCQLPDADYVVTDAIALGQFDALGNLKFRQGLCGKVLQIDCGSGPVDAVVVTTCSACGVDMIGKTWRKATGNQAPGVVDCSVSLSDRNPIRGSDPICYYRPGSEFDNDYHAILGVVNTGGRITSSAVAAGVKGVRNNNSGWFVFSGSGKPIMNKEAQVVFNYEDGSSSSFRLAECKSGGQGQIFQS